MDKRSKCANCIWGEQCSNISNLRDCDTDETENRVCDYYEGFHGDVANLIHYIKALKSNTKAYIDGIKKDDADYSTYGSVNKKTWN